MPLNVGDIVEGKYRIGRVIGEGGMGAVYEGENVRIQRRVAIKVLHAAYTENREAVQRFEREAQAAGRIGNDHILEVLDLGTLPDGDLFLVMEFLDGEPLSRRIQREGRLAPEHAAPIVSQVLVGLRAAHTAGIVHRDLKPDNVFILREKAGRPDFVKIIDFGISKFQPMGTEMRMTRTGAMMGTPYYMSPEQATGAEVDARSDLYAAGVILYECVTGVVPFDAPSFNQLLFKIALEAPRPPQEIVPALDPAFCGIIARAMAREPSQRFQEASEFAEALNAWTGGSRTAVASSSLGPDTPAELALPLATPGSGIRPAPTFGLTPAEPARTAGSWTTSGISGKRPRTSLWIALVGAAVLVAAVGGFTALRLFGPASAPQPASAEPAQLAPPTPSFAPGPTTLVAEPIAPVAPDSAPRTTESSAVHPVPPPPAARRHGAPAAPSSTVSAPHVSAPALTASAPAPAPKPVASAPPPLAAPPPPHTAPPAAPAQPTTPDFGY